MALGMGGTRRLSIRLCGARAGKKEIVGRCYVSSLVIRLLGYLEGYYYQIPPSLLVCCSEGVSWCASAHWKVNFYATHCLQVASATEGEKGWRLSQRRSGRRYGAGRWDWCRVRIQKVRKH